ncbi:MAG: hypothetical protein KDD55_13325, partial [Bdellovibrionales bacterium]|nr:hypothetical protein [Bdellovibrionales bacterium]
TKKHGTKVFFRPDPEIFKQTQFSSKILERTIQEKAFLNRGLSITFIDEGNNQKTVYCYKDGLTSYLKFLLERYSLSPIGGEVFALERADGVKVDLAFCWTESTKERIFSYVNGIPTQEGGSHADGFKSGLSKAIRNYLSVHNVALPKGVKLSADDIREGLVGVVSATVPGSLAQLQFQGQTKDRLNNPEILAPVESLTRTFENVLNSKPQLASMLVERVVVAAKARAAARVASQNVSRKIGVSRRLNLPGKLADCSSSRSESSELFIVEGDSAGGSAKQGRDRKTQAVLPLRGKVLNAYSAPLSKLKENRELSDLVAVLGCGWGEQLDLRRLRYSRVVILTDADSDGMHIASLLMAFFFKCMRPLVEAGHLYLALSPLFKVKVGSGQSEEVHWLYEEEQRDAVVKKNQGKRKIQVTRFKGLGEMNPKTLWETTLDPKHRNILRIQIDDEVEAGAMLESLLGKDSTERYRLIQENADRLELDV